MRSLAAQQRHSPNSSKQASQHNASYHRPRRCPLRGDTRLLLSLWVEGAQWPGQWHRQHDHTCLALALTLHLHTHDRVCTEAGGGRGMAPRKSPESKVNIVDLAAATVGLSESQQAEQAGITEGERRKEGNKINQSLSTLSLVIQELKEGLLQAHAPAPRLPRRQLVDDADRHDQHVSEPLGHDAVHDAVRGAGRA